jgi:DNA-nicking Smr family endonuclease
MQKKTQSTFLDYCNEQNIKPIQQDSKTTLLSKQQKLQRLTHPNEMQKSIFSNYSLLDDPLYHEEFCRDGQNKTIKMLQQNKCQVLKVLDLHHYRQNEAILELEIFINGNITPGNTCLKIVHGKGLNSPEGKSVLRSMVRRFLEYHTRVLAYTKAHNNNGGDGVTLVKLKN